MQDHRDAAASRFDAIAAELERAAGHCRVTAQHYREHNIPRAAAHAFAAYGHMQRAQADFDVASEEHASKALLPGEPMP